MLEHDHRPGGGGDIMRKYESIFIAHPSLDEEAVNKLIEKFKGVIENGKGTVENVDIWGKRRLAYEVAKVNEGIYVLINFESDSDLPKELTRMYRITDGVIRNITILKEN